MKPKRFFFITLLGGLTMAVVACSMIGGGADLERASGYSVTAPSEWRSQSRAESDRAYRLPSGNVVTIVSSCHRNSDASLDVLTRHLLIGTRDVKVLRREKAQFGDNEGLLTRVNARLEGKPFHLELFVLAKKQCVFDFSLISRKEIEESENKDFQDLIASFHYGQQ